MAGEEPCKMPELCVEALLEEHGLCKRHPPHHSLRAGPLGRVGLRRSQTGQEVLRLSQFVQPSNPVLALARPLPVHVGLSDSVPQRFGVSAALRPHKARSAILLQCGMSGALRPQGPPISQGPPHGVSKRPVASASLLALNSVAPAAPTLPPPARDSTCCCRALQTAVAFARHAQSRRRRHSTRGGLRRALSSWRSTRTPLAVTLHVVGAGGAHVSPLRRTALGGSAA